MENLWDDNEAKQYKTDLGLRVYSSRLLGRNPDLVLHGGGNTSVKIREKNILGKEEDVLYVKGSGWDLATIEEPGFSPVKMEPLLGLAELESLSDPQMVNELKTNLKKAGAPGPSVETILHAVLPFRFVDHTHADAVVAVTNTEKGEEKIREIYGDRVVIVPYVMPGFDLARLCNKVYRENATDKTEGIVLMNHGIFTFSDDAKTSYDRMIELVGLAEEFLKSKNAFKLSPPVCQREKVELGKDIAGVRKDISDAAGFPVIVNCHQDDITYGFANHPDVERISQQGPATPDHVIRTKRTPMVGTDVQGYVEGYKKYFDSESKNAKEPKTMLDPAPRALLDKKLGFCSIGRSAKEAGIVSDIYRHTIEIILAGEAQGGYRALPPSDIFEVEYWDLEQAKLKKAGNPPVFSGEVALVTGAASGIGKACVKSFLDRGAAVIGLDVNPDIETLFERQDFLGISCDLTVEEQVKEALETGVRNFGGVDMLVMNAGIFPKSSKISQMETGYWRQVMGINLDSNLVMMRECHPYLSMAHNGGRVVVIGSKNVPAPGPGAAAYSASKAAVNQLARVAALEWGGENIRINTLHPNAVFDTGIWTEEVLKSRAKSYGLSVDEYKRNNVLKTEVSSANVAELAAEMCGPLFAKTTGAWLPVDGGNERVI